jgi:translation elongation factor P
MIISGVQVELRDLASGLKSSERLRTSESIERVFVEDKTYTFLYAEGDSIILMEPKSFEQVTLLRNLLGTGAAYLADGMEVVVQLYDGQPFSAKVPARVTCSVIEAEPYFKGQTATPTYKRVVLENGQQVMAPSFITAGDRIVIETADNSYVTRSVAGHFVSEASPAFPVFLFAIVVFLLTQLLSLHRILIP